MEKENVHSLTIEYFTNKALNTAVYPGQGNLMGLVYCALKLNGEAGEFAEKLGKILRDDAGVISEEKRRLLLLELGDVSWYIINAAKELNSSFEEVLVMNNEKLESRQKRNKIHGSGDER